jgi:hypothetical protein
VTTLSPKAPNAIEFYAGVATDSDDNNANITWLAPVNVAPTLSGVNAVVQPAVTLAGSTYTIAPGPNAGNTTVSFDIQARSKFGQLSAVQTVTMDVTNTAVIQAPGQQSGRRPHAEPALHLPGS